jgi:RNA polymerase sigma-54 factor
MKHSLQLKLSQHLTLTPQLQQSIRLLQLSTVELNQELERYLAENPLLERADLTGEENPEPSGAEGAPASASTSVEAEAPPAPEDSSSFGDEPSTGPRRGDDDRDDFTQIAAAEPTLQEYLIRQLQLMQLTERDKRLALVVIMHLDGDGYLKATLEELVQVARTELEDLEAEEITTAIRQIQNLEPAGVGACDLAECLALQLRALDPATPHRDCAIELVTRHLDALASRDYNRLKRQLGIDDDGLREVRALILTLDPKPGRAWSEGDVRFVVPDVTVRKVGGRWLAQLNRDAMPRLRINKMYADLLQSSRDSGGRNLSGQLQEARWLIKNVQQRFDTILRVTQAIVDRQKNFFEHGEVAMRPLVLREIAEAVGLHEEQKQALALAYFRGYTQGEIATALGAPLGTIKTRIRLAMDKLRAALQGQT